MHEIIEVQEIGPVIRKLPSHWQIIALTGETLILLTAANKIISSSCRTVLGSSLAKKVIAIHLWKNQREGC
jgi:hypothetical protein